MGSRSTAARGVGPATEEEEEVGVEEGEGPEDAHAPELGRAHHAQRLAVHGEAEAVGLARRRRRQPSREVCTDRTHESSIWSLERFANYKSFFFSACVPLIGSEVFLWASCCSGQNRLNDQSTWGMSYTAAPIRGSPISSLHSRYPLFLRCSYPISSSSDLLSRSPAPFSFPGHHSPILGLLKFCTPRIRALGPPLPPDRGSNATGTVSSSASKLQGRGIHHHESGVVLLIWSTPSRSSSKRTAARTPSPPYPCCPEVAVWVRLLGGGRTAC